MLDLAPCVVERPVGLLADVDAVERRLGDVDVPRRSARQVAVEERQQQRGDVVAVGVGVHQQEDPAVAQLAMSKLVADAAAERLTMSESSLLRAPWRRRPARR
jgi:hypothetical protein